MSETKKDKIDQTLEFSYNWNEKLNCKYYTTLRLSNNYKIGKTYLVYLKGKPHSKGKIISRRQFHIHAINEFVAYLDTGYNATKCKDILKKMYKYKMINWKKQLICLYLVEKHPITLL